MPRPIVQEVLPKHRDAWLQNFDSLPRRTHRRFQSVVLILLIGAMISLVGGLFFYLVRT